MATTPRNAAATCTPVSGAIAREGEVMLTHIDRFFPEPFSRLLSEPIGRPLPEPFATAILAQPFGWTPPVEIVETDEEFTLTAELPDIVPAAVDANAMTAAMNDGVLSVHLPKAVGEKPRRRQIELLGNDAQK